jgi:cadmium resistance protein CadD (predicted permease)
VIRLTADSPWQGAGVGWLWQAVVLFAVTNVDDMVVLSLYYGRARAEGHGAVAITVGRYVGFLVILAVSVAGALGEGLLPDGAIRFIGVVPILIGVRAGWLAWRSRDKPAEKETVEPPRVMTVAGITLANGGDNVGVYIPAFATVSHGVLVGYSVVFLVMVAIWCLAAHALTGHAGVARWIGRWGHIIYPIALIAIGAHILISG